MWLCDPNLPLPLVALVGPMQSLATIWVQRACCCRSWPGAVANSFFLRKIRRNMPGKPHLLWAPFWNSHQESWRPQVVPAIQRLFWENKGPKFPNLVHHSGGAPSCLSAAFRPFELARLLFWRALGTFPPGSLFSRCQCRKPAKHCFFLLGQWIKKGSCPHPPTFPSL